MISAAIDATDPLLRSRLAFSERTRGSFSRFVLRGPPETARASDDCLEEVHALCFVGFPEGPLRQCARASEELARSAISRTNRMKTPVPNKEKASDR